VIAGSITRDCNNSEVVSNDLVITKLVLEVDTDFGPYARCNICVNGTDGHGNNSCVDGVYDCVCTGHHGSIVPCGPPVGYVNVSSYHRDCNEGDPDWVCWRNKVRPLMYAIEAAPCCVCRTTSYCICVCRVGCIKDQRCMVFNARCWVLWRQRNQIRKLYMARDVRGTLSLSQCALGGRLGTILICCSCPLFPP